LELKDATMRRYKFGRALAWLLITGSLLLATFGLGSLLFGLGSYVGLLEVPIVLRMIGVGLFLALVGFAFLLLSDVAEAYLRKQA
jgi:hypothetical protein